MLSSGGESGLVAASWENRVPTASTLSYLKRSGDCGDSGGPTYALPSEGRALAAGITEGRIKMSFLGFDSYYWCYVTIDDALGVGSFTLATGK